MYLSKREQPILDRRGLLIGAGLTAVAGLSYWRAPSTVVAPLAEGQFSAAMPAKVDGWQSRASAEVVLPPQDDSNKLYENLETRIYEGPGLPAIMLLIAYSSVQQNDIQVHRPEVCYPASGYPILSSRHRKLELAGKVVDATELKADRGGLVEKIIYWVRVGDEFPVNWSSQRVSMAKANLNGRIPDGVLFRVSAIEDPTEDVSEKLNNFIPAFLGKLPPMIRQRIIS